jgi:hypothetical protein
MEKIIENATIIYKNGLRRIFNAISIQNKGVYIGFIKNNNYRTHFINHSFIPIDQIKKIVFFNDKGKNENIILSKDIKEVKRK